MIYYTGIHLISAAYLSYELGPPQEFVDTETPTRIVVANTEQGKERRAEMNDMTRICT